MWDACCSLAESPSIVASLAVGAIGLCLLSKAVDDWQAERHRIRAGDKAREAGAPLRGERKLSPKR
jgi:hypothetical protein